MDSNDLLKDVFSDLQSSPAAPQPEIGEGTGGLAPDPALFDGNSNNQNVQSSIGTPSSNADVQTPDPSKVTPEGSVSDDLSWDSLIEDGAAVSTPGTETIDWKLISNAVGVSDEFKGPEDLTKYVETLKRENSDLKARPTLDDSLPGDLKDAIEIWKNQGDYHSVFDVGAIDYSVIDPVELWEDEMENHFVNPDGTVREQEYYDYIDSVSDMDKSIRGKQIQQNLIAQQKFQLQTVKQKAEREKAENLKNLEVALNRFDKVGDFAVTPKVRQQLYKDIASGEFLREMGISLTGAHQFEKLQSMYFKAKYFDTIQKFNEQRTRTNTLRQEVEKVGNHNLTPTNRLGNPTETVKKDAIEMYFDRQGIKK
jgi:hypothetical protein